MARNSSNGSPSTSTTRSDPCSTIRWDTIPYQVVQNQLSSLFCCGNNVVLDDVSREMLITVEQTRTDTHCTSAGQQNVLRDFLDCFELVGRSSILTWLRHWSYNCCWDFIFVTCASLCKFLLGEVSTWIPLVRMCRLCQCHKRRGS